MTVAKQYLPSSFCHPRHHLREGFATSFWKKDTRYLRLLDLKNLLLDRHYSIQLINEGIERAKSINTEKRRITKRKKKHPTPKTLAYILTYSPINNEKNQYNHTKSTYITQGYLNVKNYTQR